jgi:hypothetical protein
VRHCANDSDTFPVGEVTMGANFVIDGIPAGPTFEPPHIEVDWSCQYDSVDPHFEVLTVPQAYAARLSNLGLTGVTSNHRLVLRNYPGPDVVTFELEGRHEQRFILPVSDPVNGVMSFDHQSNQYGEIDMQGTMSKVGDNVVVDFDVLVLAGHNLGSINLTLQPFNE